MKNKPGHLTSRPEVITAASCSLAVLFSVASSYAADKTWDGGGDGSNWSASPANWSDDAAPAAGDSLFFGSAAGGYLNNDFAAATAFSGITFNTGAGALTLAGNELNLTGGVTNASSSAQVISLNMNQTGTRNHFAAGDMLYDGAVKSQTLAKYGPGTITLGGTVDNPSLRASVYDGVLELAKSGSVRALGSSPILVTNTGVLRIVAGVATDQIHYNQRVVIEGGGKLQVQNSFEEIGSISGSATFGGIIENGLEGTTARLDVGGGSGHEGIYNGEIRDGAGILNFRQYRHDNKTVLNGTNTYTGTTEINNTSGTGTTRLIVNGQHTGGGAYTVNGHSSTTDRFASLGGSGLISASSVDFNMRGILSPGGALSADLSDSAVFSETTAILTLEAPVKLNHAASTLDVQLNGSAAGSGYDQVKITGAGTFVNTSANLKLALGFTPVEGDKFTIVQVPGTDPANNTGTFASLNGVATDLAQGATFVEPISGQYLKISYRAEGSTFDAGEGNGNDIMLMAVAPVGGAKLTWRGNATGNNWDVITTPNWFNGTSLVTFTNADFVTFDDTGSNQMPVNLVGDLSPASIAVKAAKDYVFAGSGKLTGSIVLTKTNSGTLSLVTENDTTGSTTVNGGTLQIGTNDVTGWLTGTITVNSNGTLAVNRSDDITFTNTALGGTGTFMHKGSGLMAVTTDIPFAGKTVINGGNLQLGTGGSLFGSLAGDINVPAGKKLVYKYSNGEKMVYNSLSGSGTVDYDSSLGGTIRIATTAVSSNFSGTANLITGTRLWASDGNSGYSLGNGSTFNVPEYCQIWLDRSATAYNQVFNIIGNGYAGDSPELGALRVFGAELNGQINLLGNARIGGTISGATIRAPIRGAYQLEILGNADFTLSIGPTNGLHEYQSTLVTRGVARALNTNAFSTGPMTLDAAATLRLNGNNITVASLTSAYSGLVSGNGAVVDNGHGSAYATLTVGSDNSSTTFDGVFGNGSGGALGLRKVGTGTFTVTGVNTNTGTVTVDGGTLALNGAASFAKASNIVVNATLDVSGIGGVLNLSEGQMLGGSGTVNGSIAMTAASIIKPGASVGVLTIANGADLAGGQLVMDLNRSMTPNSDRLVSTSGTITGSAVLTVTNVGPALEVGDTFQLFASGMPGVVASLPTVDIANARTYTWQNNIAANGSIRVASVSMMEAPTLGSSVSGNTLSLSWTGPYKLQAQTNSLNQGLGNNWSDYQGGTTSPVSVTIDPAQPTVFFRLILQ